MQIDEALSFLDAFQNYEKGMAKYGETNYRPETTAILLKKAGLEPINFPIFHIAGTKGKGSTAHYLAEILSNSDFSKTGLYTSPHLYRLNERIRIDQIPVSDAALAALVSDYQDLIQNEKPTYFEALTFLGMAHFIRENSKAVVLETGLGGRLDATNFCNPAVSVITAIGYDHTAILGNTLPEIAGEKAGIIKPGIPCVTALQENEVLKAIQEAAVRLKSPLILFSDHIHYTITDKSPDGSRFNAEICWKNLTISLENILLKQTGTVFVQNFLLAGLAALAGRINVSQQSMTKAAGLKLPGRMEKRGNILFDVAHNDSSFESLFQTLKDYYSREKKNLFIGILSDKEIIRIAETIARGSGLFESITIFDFETYRSSGGRALYELIKDKPNVNYAENIRDLSPRSGFLNVFAGSFYTAQMVKDLFG